jgi:arsenite/tail-anchored protein-transporting ATPase
MARLSRTPDDACSHVVAPMTAQTNRVALEQLRAILVTGKGGVGKTTLAAAIARNLANKQIRVLCTELVGAPDADSPLARLLGVNVAGSEPVAVGPYLSFARVDPNAGHLSFLRHALPLKVMADAAMQSAAIRRFLMAAPSLPEMGALYRLLELTELRLPNGEPRYQSIICDLPATGHAVALAQIPASILQIIERGPIADAVRRGLNLLYDPAKSAAIIVTLPETLPVSESLELGAALADHGIAVRGIVLNRMPKSPLTSDECHQVTAALAGISLQASTQAVGDSGHVRGARLFGRIARAEAAKLRLHDAGTTLLAELTEQSQDAMALASDLVEAVNGC